MNTGQALESSPSEVNPRVVLAMKNINKSFAVPVLKNLCFEVNAGEIHALVGSNGAGKSTLCNIISGVLQANSGDLTLNGNPYKPENIQTAEAQGIRMVMQELNLFPTLNIAENICFKALGGKYGFISKQALQEKARSALQLLKLEHLDPDQAVAELGVGQQQLIEIARVIAEPVQLLILDEPTAALTDPETEQLFEQLGQLRARGVSIIYISHRMNEIARISDRVSVLRDGEMIATVNTKQTTADDIVALIAGEDSQNRQREAEVSGDRAADIKPVLKVENLCSDGKLTDINLSVNCGEVLGIGGLIGSGRTEILRAISGADVADSGGVRLAEDNFATLQRFTTPQQGISAGIGLIVEDRKHQGLMLSCSITHNVSIGNLGAANTKLRNRAGWLNSTAENELIDNICKQLDVKYDSREQAVSQLSGGNQQKILIGRWLIKDLPILLFDEASRGVDARAKALIQDIIREQARQGKAVIVVSSETQELVDISDRILVLSNGRLAGEFDPDAVTEEQLMDASFKYYSNE